MKATQRLHDLGQSIWLDNITRSLLNSGTLNRYIEELSVPWFSLPRTQYHPRSQSLAGRGHSHIRGRSEPRFLT